MKIAAWEVDSRLVTWVREFLSGHLQELRGGGQLSEEVRVTSRVPQGNTMGPLLFLAYVNIWRNLESTIKLFADDYTSTIYRKIMNDSDTDMLQIDVDRLGEWEVENAMNINPGKCKAVSFTKTWVKYPLNYFSGTKEF
jgi:hypothetical protein